MLYGMTGFEGAGKDVTGMYLADAIEGVLADGARKFTEVKLASLASPLHDAAEILFGAEGLERKNKETDQSVSYGECLGASVLAASIVFEGDKEKLDKAVDIASQLFSPARSEEKVKISPRTFMQVLGAHVIRSVDKDAFLNRIISMDSPTTVVIVTDVRYFNEMKAMNRIWNVVRPDAPKVELKHESQALACVLKQSYDLVKGDTDVPHIVPCQTIKKVLHVVNNSTLEALSKLFKD